MSGFKLIVLAFYLYGFAVVMVDVVIASTLLLWFFQGLAHVFGETFQWGVIYEHLILGLAFLAFFPGQTVWTLRLNGPGGHRYTIVGEPPPRGVTDP